MLPVCIVPISIYSRKVRKSARALQTHAADLSKLMHESFTGNRVVKAYSLEGTMVTQFRATTQKYVSQIMRILRANEMPGAVMEVLGSIGIAAVIFSVFHTGIKAGDLISFVGSIYIMYAPIKNVTRLYNQLHQAQAASARVFELLAIKNDIVDPPNPVPLKATGAEINFENVDFSYGEKAVLRGVNLTVKSGQLVAFVGLSGSGKTTLVNLLPRFYDPQRGTIRIGGTNIRDASVADLRRQIAIVTQETILFHDTIRSNIAAGSNGVSDAQIEAAARAANAHQFHRGQTRGLQHHRRRKRRRAFRRATPAPLHRPRHSQGRADPNPRRGHQRPRCRIRARRPGGIGKTDGRPHHDLHRPSPFHHSKGGCHRGA